MFHIVSLSGGKDSTAMLLMMLEKKMPVDYILFCDTGVEFPEMYEHLQKIDDYIGERYGKHITYLKADKDYQYYFSERVITKGERKGTKGYGYASTRNRWCTDRLKVKPQEKFTKALKQPYILYCGIAADEPERLKQYEHKRYPLAEWGVTEAECLDYCKALGFTWGGACTTSSTEQAVTYVLSKAKMTGVFYIRITQNYLNVQWKLKQVSKERI